MTVLVCGGAGYIGAHMVQRLQADGLDVLVLDNFSTGHRKAVADVRVVEGDIRCAQDLDRAFAVAPITAVMHFCALALVGESMREPLDYYDNNVVGTLRLLQAMRRHGVDQLIFSSTCATFGNPQHERIAEAHPQQPINPYGASKLMCERLLADAAAAHGISSVSLRYFNAAGADPAGRLGESHSPESHLIPNVIRFALGQSAELQVHGNDYATPDGTCVRDYVHVLDLADAHARALAWLATHPGAHAFNLGCEQGRSVLEVIAAVADRAGRALDYRSCPRRPGDPPVLVADSRRARETLGWTPQRSALETIVNDAWNWHLAQRY